MDPTVPDPPAHRLGRAQLIALDAVAAAGYTALLAGMPAAGGAPAWLRIALTAATVLPVAARRVWPVPVFAVVLALTVVTTVLRLGAEPFVAAAYAIYPVAVERSRPWRMPAPVAVFGGAAVLLVLALGMTGSGNGGPAVPHPPWWLGPLFTLVFGVALMAGAWTVGSAVRERRAYAVRAAERLAERAATEERLRIARELHDVVAHGMSLIAVKAGVANHVLRERPEEAHDALRIIEATSRGALTELRSMLGVLRDGDAPADLGPAPGLAHLPELVERAAMAGVRAETDVRGADGLPGGVQLAVFRIVQEALTNVVKHAAPARCRVVVAVDDGAVTVEVTDDGPGVRVLPGGSPAGHGLVGMHERAAVYGGACTAGPLPGGGFGVSARIPVPS